MYAHRYRMDACVFVVEWEREAQTVLYRNMFVFVDSQLKIDSFTCNCRLYRSVNVYRWFGKIKNFMIATESTCVCFTEVIWIRATCYQLDLFHCQHKTDTEKKWKRKIRCCHFEELTANASVASANDEFYWEAKQKRLKHSHHPTMWHLSFEICFIHRLFFSPASLICFRSFFL